MKRFAPLFLLLCWPASAQNSAAKVRQQFDDCVYASVTEQWKANPSLDANTTAELAFSACSTEEQAMYSILALAHLPVDQATAAVVAAKLQIKRAIRGIVANTPKYLPKK